MKAVTWNELGAQPALRDDLPAPAPGARRGARAHARLIGQPRRQRDRRRDRRVSLGEGTASPRARVSTARMSSAGSVSLSSSPVAPDPDGNNVEVVCHTPA
jgi:hypothetical protein